MKEFKTITPQQIASNGVQSLADRPNVSSRYGEGGLSARDLKAWFDRLAQVLAEHVNEIKTVLNSDQAGEYIKMPMALRDYDIFDLDGFVQSFITGKVAEMIYAFPNAAAQGPTNLQNIIYSLSNNLSEKDEVIRHGLAGNWTLEQESGTHRHILKLLSKESEVLGRIELDLSVNTDRIVSGAVTAEKLADNSVTTDKLQGLSVTFDKLGNGAVGSRALSTGAVGSDKLSLELSNRLLNLENNAVTGVRYDPTNGQILFSMKSGEFLVDLPLELITSGGHYDGTAGSEAIVLDLANGDNIRIPVSQMLSGLMSYMDGIREKIYDLQEAPPLAALSDSLLLCTPTLAQIAALN